MKIITDYTAEDLLHMHLTSALLDIYRSLNYEEASNLGDENSSIQELRWLLKTNSLSDLIEAEYINSRARHNEG